MELNSNTGRNILVLSRWLKFVGIIHIIGGIFLCMTFIYAIFGWVPIVVGVWMLKSSSSFKTFINNSDSGAFDVAIEKLKNIYMLTGIVTIVEIFVVLFLIVVFLIIMKMGLFFIPMNFNRIFN